MASIYTSTEMAIRFAVDVLDYYTERAYEATEHGMDAENAFREYRYGKLNLPRQCGKTTGMVKIAQFDNGIHLLARKGEMAEQLISLGVPRFRVHSSIERMSGSSALIRGVIADECQDLKLKTFRELTSPLGSPWLLRVETKYK